MARPTQLFGATIEISDPFASEQADSAARYYGAPYYRPPHDDSPPPDWRIL
jgi:hypothetical protein